MGIERDKDTLLGFEDAARLQQYLYLDGSHEIIIENEIGAKLRLSMDDDCRIICRLAEKPDSTAMDYTANMDCPAWLACIDQLKEQPSQFPQFKNRWDEIWQETAIARALNKPAAKRGIPERRAGACQYGTYS